MVGYKGAYVAYIDIDLDFLIIKLLSRKQNNFYSIFAIWHKERRDYLNKPEKKII